MLDIAIGPVDENLQLASRAMQMQVKKDGTTTLNIGDGSAIVNISPDGAIAITSKSTVSVTATGDIGLKTDGGVNVDAGGDVNVTASGNATVKATKISLNGEASGIITSNSSGGVVDYITGAPLTPSTTVFGDI